MALETAADFANWVDFKVAEQLNPRLIDFSKLVEGLPGIYPTEVLASLERFDTSHPLNGTAMALAHSATDPNGVPRSNARPQLLPPHPLDYEWRFSEEAIDVLVKTCLICTESRQRVALVGTPTIAACTEARFGDRAVTYFGVDTAALKGAGLSWLSALIEVNLLERPSGAGPFATVVIDPPWYEEYARRFVWFAGLITDVGSTLLLAMPPDGTRPGILRENNSLLGWCQELGFELVSVEPASLPYDTPPFERNALRAAGVLNVHPTWRKANLWRLNRIRAELPDWPGNVTHRRWAEHCFDAVRIRIDHCAPSRGDDPRLRSIVENDVLPTVSRRDGRRHEARVWTTGNRVFGCDSPALLSALLDDLRSQRSTVDVSAQIKQEAFRQISIIVEREFGELLQ